MKKKIQLLEQSLGSGGKPSKGSLVKIELEVFAINGQKILSTKDEGKQIQFVFRSGKMLKGLETGMYGMREGGRKKILVPNDLISPTKELGYLNELGLDLVFDIEIISVQTWI